jgi:hypothetical protein
LKSPSAQTTCDGVLEEIGTCIPAVSHWGLLIMTLTLAAAAKAREEIGK